MSAKSALLTGGVWLPLELHSSAQCWAHSRCSANVHCGIKVPTRQNPDLLEEFLGWAHEEPQDLPAAPGTGQDLVFLKHFSYVLFNSSFLPPVSFLSIF